MNVAALARPDPLNRVASVQLAGIELLLDPAGIVYEPASGTLVAADLHLEKAAAFAARGQFLPPYETRDTLRRLARLAEFYAPRRIVLLGDSFHAKDCALAPGSEALLAFEAIARGREIVWIAGNHDPAPPKNVPGIACDALDLAGIVLRHAPVSDGRAEMIGHLHPAARIVTRAGTRRKKCFVLGMNRLLLPAFGSLTGGVDVFDRHIRCWFDPFATDVFLLGDASLHRAPMRFLAQP